MQTRDFVYVKDVAKANIQVMEAGSQGVFNIASGRETSVNELAAILLDLFNVKYESEYCPERPGEVTRSVADISRAVQAFGYHPQFSLKEGLLDTISHLR